MTPCAGELKTLAAALDEFRTRPTSPEELKAAALPVPTRFHKARDQRRKFETVAGASWRKARKFIRPENAEALLPHLPEVEEERLHVLLAGDFVFCDLLAAIIAKRGTPRRLVCATLSLSRDNLATLAALVEARGFALDLLLSHYFSKTSRDIWGAALALAEREPRVRVRATRSHCKVTLFDYPEAPLVIESSANLRSSSNLEQASFFVCRDLYEFHAAWIEEAGEAPAP